jgi:hypothetical protein
VICATLTALVEGVAMARYWSYEVCGWVESAPADALSTPWSGHGLAAPGTLAAVSPADLVGPPGPAAPLLPGQRPTSATAPVGA